MNRKDDHIRLALEQNVQENDFDRVRFAHQALATLQLQAIDLSVTQFNRTFKSPVYINAMTGGSDQAKIINQRLAMLAKELELPMATGSLSAALKDPRLVDTFTIITEINPDGFYLANIGADVDVDRALKAVDMIHASALQIHLNVAQELIMPEGDRDFQSWPINIEAILKASPVPVIIKEVGFGMSRESIARLHALGATTFDVGGHGGTNFAKIENARRAYSLSYLNDWGLSTVESLLEAKAHPELTFFASGGIRHALDVIKALALGAQMVGLSSYFLRIVKDYPHEQAVQEVKTFIDELNALMVLVGAQNIRELRTKPLILDLTLENFLNQRQR